MSDTRGVAEGDGIAEPSLKEQLAAARTELEALRGVAARLSAAEAELASLRSAYSERCAAAEAAEAQVAELRGLVQSLGGEPQGEPAPPPRAAEERPALEEEPSWLRDAGAAVEYEQPEGGGGAAGAGGGAAGGGAPAATDDASGSDSAEGLGDAEETGEDGRWLPSEGVSTGDAPDAAGSEGAAEGVPVGPSKATMKRRQQRRKGRQMREAGAPESLAPQPPLPAAPPPHPYQPHMQHPPPQHYRPPVPSAPMRPGHGPPMGQRPPPPPPPPPHHHPPPRVHAPQGTWYPGANGHQPHGYLYPPQGVAMMAPPPGYGVAPYTQYWYQAEPQPELVPAGVPLKQGGEEMMATYAAMHVPHHPPHAQPI